MKTILTDKRRKILKEIQETGMMSCGQHLALIPTCYEIAFFSEKLVEVEL